MKKFLNNIIVSFMIGICIFSIIMVLMIISLPEVSVKYLLFFAITFAVMITVIVFIIMSLSKKQNTNYKKHISLENIPPEFEKVYSELYSSHIASLEKMRKQVRWRTIIEVIAYIFAIVGYAFAKADDAIISNTVDTNIIIGGLIAFFFAIIFSYKNIKYKKKYSENYKKEIIVNFIHLLNNQLLYNPTDMNFIRAQNDYKIAEFDNKKFNRFYVDDFIEGNLDENIFLKMCDLHIQNHTGSGRNSHTEEIFQGLFSKTDCNKDINTVIKISKNKIKILNQENRVEMDSQEFEKYFDVYSENRLVAMQLLTSVIMELFVNFYKEYELEYEVVFKNNSIYMRFFTGPMFEPKIFGSSMDKQLLYMYFCILKFVLETTKMVNKTLQEAEI